MRDPDNLNVHQVAEQLKIGYRRVHELIDSGALGEVHRVGWRVSVKATAVEAYRAKMTAAEP
jgi:excisionase family DNA binding protein